MFPGGFNDPFGGPPKFRGGFNDFPGPGGPNFGGRRPRNGQLDPDLGFGGFNPDFTSPPPMQGPYAGLGYPNNPDFNPAFRPNRNPGLREDPKLAQPRNPGLGNFAPPGSAPQIGNKPTPDSGVDGQGSLIVTPPKKPAKDIKGDYDEMCKLGLVDQPNEEMPFNPNLYI